MDIKAQLLTEHSKTNADLIRNWIGNDCERFTILVQLFLENEYRVSQRAAMVLGHLYDAHPEMIAPFLPKIIKHLRKPDIHDAVKRNIVRILQTIDLPKKHHGQVADICFNYLADPNTAVAIRAFSMTVLWNICLKVPELMPELKATIEDWLEHGTKGFESRGKQILRLIAKYERVNAK